MFRLLTRAGRLGSRATALAADRDGSITTLFALAALPIIGLVGLGIDYGMAIAAKTRLDNAADAAALAAVVTAKAYIAEHAGQTGVWDEAIKAGKSQATKAFNINAANVPFAKVTFSPPEVGRAGAATVNATVTYTATVPKTIGKIFGAEATTLSDTVTASADVASYLDFYLMVDVSGSMGLPTSDADAKALSEINIESQGKCQFACHFPGSKGWDLAAGKIQLRSDSVNNAVCELLKRAATPAVSNQYRIGIYPFINRLATLATLSDTTTSLSTLNTAAQCSNKWPLAFTNLLDTGATQLYSGTDPTTGTGSGGTHFEKALPQMQSTVQTYGFGDGSTATSRRPFVFLITDGMQNGQSYSSWKDTKTFPGRSVKSPYTPPSPFSSYRYAEWDGSKPAQIDPTKCDDLKKAGATISLLYIPYKKVENYSKDWYINWENDQVNAFSPTLEAPLRKCASPGFFYTANTSADITASLAAMFDQALRVACITH